MERGAVRSVSHFLNQRLFSTHHVPGTTLAPDRQHKQDTVPFQVQMASNFILPRGQQAPPSLEGELRTWCHPFSPGTCLIREDRALRGEGYHAGPPAPPHPWGRTRCLPGPPKPHLKTPRIGCWQSFLLNRMYQKLVQPFLCHSKIRYRIPPRLLTFPGPQ